MAQPYKIEISSRTIIFTIVFILLLQLLWIVRELIFSLIIAFIIMSALSPVVSYLERYKVPRTLSTLIIFLSIMSGIGFIFSWIVPAVATETTLLFKNITHYLGGVSHNVGLDQDFFTKSIPSITNNAVLITKNIFSSVIFFISTLFFSFYFLVEEHAIKNFLLKFFDRQKAQAIAEIFEKAEYRMRAWLWGELILMLIIGIVTFIGLSLLGIPYALPLALIAGLLEAVPIIGPIIAALPAILIVSSQSSILILAIVALYFIIQQLENQIVVPFIMKKAVGLNPIVTLAALIIGGKLAGFLGIFLAIPIMLFLETILVEAAQMRSQS
ncbi:MAG: AI-2E family transporter [Patescibacteria group bacterium]